ncbi:MAG: DUF3108 domain-containing protein [Sphingobacteriaceae bacterium]|nr:MAG: DUF3108 domain-containing protein [Sphingobacteriaceae bacterium]
MIKKLWVSIVFLVFLQQLVTGQELVRRSNLAFKDGEQLTYRLKYGIFTAAEASLKIEESGIKFDGKPTYHIVVDGRTAGSFDIFFKVRNRYESFIDRTTTLPYYYTENRREGKYRRTDKVTFDYDSKKITAQTGTYPFKGIVFDLPSILPGRIFKQDSKLYLWITNDGNRIPVKAQVEILVGTVTLEITNTKGLKYAPNQ